MLNQYFDRERIDGMIAAGLHREAIGGRWDEIGALQERFLVTEGLLPSHRLLDVGCGSLRAGVRFAAYLQAGRYFGIDVSQALLDAGYDIELAQAGLQAKVPRDHLHGTGEFEIPWRSVVFDFAIAQSVFTHLPAAQFRLCLRRLASVTIPGSRFYASVLDVPDDHPIDHMYARPNGVTTYRYSDPYHYRVAEVLEFADGLPWQASWIGDWGHPRGARMVRYERPPDEAMT